MRKLNVLLVDDSPLFLKLARELLATSDGVDRIDCAGSGSEALARAAKWPPDLVLTDIQMPNMNGFDLIRALRAREIPPRVVAMTVQDTPQYRAAALRMGAEDCIAKHELGALLPEMVASLSASPAARGEAL